MVQLPFNVMHLINKKLVEGNEQLRGLISKGKSITHSWSCSSNFQLEFLEKQKQFDKKKKLQMGVETRWNTCNKMLTSLLDNKDVLHAINDQYIPQPLTPEDCAMCQTVKSKLDLISINLRTFEKSDTPTIHTVFPLIISLSKLVKKGKTKIEKELSFSLEKLLTEYYGTNSEELASKVRTLLLATYLAGSTN